MYWRGINESDPPTGAIYNLTSGHKKYHKVPNERYGQDLSADTPYTHVGQVVWVI